MNELCDRETRPNVLEFLTQSSVKKFICEGCPLSQQVALESGSLQPD